MTRTIPPGARRASGSAARPRRRGAAFAQSIALLAAATTGAWSSVHRPPGAEPSRSGPSESGDRGDRPDRGGIGSERGGVATAGPGTGPEAAAEPATGVRTDRDPTRGMDVEPGVDLLVGDLDLARLVARGPDGAARPPATSVGGPIVVPVATADGGPVPRAAADAVRALAGAIERDLAAAGIARGAALARSGPDGRAVLVLSTDPLRPTAWIRPDWREPRRVIEVPLATMARFTGPGHVLLERPRTAAELAASPNAGTARLLLPLDLAPGAPPPRIARHTLRTDAAGGWIGLDAHGDVRRGDVPDDPGRVLLAGPATAVALDPSGRFAVVHLERAEGTADTLEERHDDRPAPPPGAACESGDAGSTVAPRLVVIDLARAGERTPAPRPADGVVAANARGMLGPACRTIPAGGLEGGPGLLLDGAWHVLGRTDGPPGSVLFRIDHAGTIRAAALPALETDRLVAAAPGGSGLLMRSRTRDAATGTFPLRLLRRDGTIETLPTTRWLGGPPAWLRWSAPPRAAVERAASARSDAGERPGPARAESARGVRPAPGADDRPP